MIIRKLIKRLDDLDRRRQFEHFQTSSNKKASEDFNAILAGNWPTIRRALVLMGKSKL